MNYTLHQLRVFVEVARTQSITKAAEALHLTQPAVSIQLKNFQDQFDIPLTETISRRIYLTDFGREIADAAEIILDQALAINHKMLAYKGLLYGKLKISVVSTGKYVIPYFLSGFIRQHEGIELVMDVTNRNRVIDSLEKNEVDFSLVSILPDHLALNQIDLMPNKLYLVGPDLGEITKQEHEAALLTKLPLIFREMGSGTRSTMEKFVDNQQISVQKKLELTSNEAVKQALIAGLGYSIMPLIGIKNELLDNELSIIPIKGLPLQTVWTLVWRKDKKLSPVATEYLDYIERNKETIIRRYFDWYQRF